MKIMYIEATREELLANKTTANSIVDLVSRLSNSFGFKGYEENEDCNEE